MSTPVLSNFCGRSTDDLRQFIYLVHFSKEVARSETDKYRIIGASSFLSGEALDWFLDLLHQNAEKHVARKNSPFVHGGPFTVYENDPFAWTDPSFWIEELQGWDAFVNALWVKFGHCKGEREGSTRASSPQSMSTIALFSSATSDATA